MNTTFQERSCWVSLLATGAVAAWFYSQTLPMLTVDELPERAGLMAYTTISAVAVGLLIVMQVVGHVIAAVVSRPEGEDERDRLISLRADQVSGIVLGIGVISTIGHVLAAGWFEEASVALLGSPFGVLNLLVGAMVLAECARCLTQIVLYRRDA
jgi:hypothetical protein